jgi:hypothetical protein
MTNKLICLVLLLFLGGCKSHSEEKKKAHMLVDGGEWIVKYTEFDPIPPKVNPDGSVRGTSFGSSCAYCKDGEGLDIRVGKNTDPYEVGDYGLCIQKSHPQYAEFARLRRGNRVHFEYVDTPIQEECAGEIMFMKIKQ